MRWLALAIVAGAVWWSLTNERRIRTRAMEFQAERARFAAFEAANRGDRHLRAA